MSHYFTCLILGLSLMPAASLAQGQPERNQPTVIYFVRHAEVDATQPTVPLNADGRQRAEAFARTVTTVAFTHVFSSHTTRARQMVEPVARDHHLVVQQFPRPEVEIDGSVVSDRTPSQAAVTPLVNALRELPSGSTAVVGVNSDNIYAILNGLGVPAATPDRPCRTGRTCVPCLTKACAPARFDQLWILIVERSSGIPALIEMRY